MAIRHWCYDITADWKYFEPIIFQWRCLHFFEELRLTDVVAGWEVPETMVRPMFSLTSKLSIATGCMILIYLANQIRVNSIRNQIFKVRIPYFSRVSAFGFWFKSRRYIIHEPPNNASKSGRPNKWDFFVGFEIIICRKSTPIALGMKKGFPSTGWLKS